MQIPLPAFSLVVLVGPSGVGKSTFARQHFRPTEILSSDAFRAMVIDDEGDQSVSRDAFEILHLVATRRLLHHRLTVIDATNVEPRARQNLLTIAQKASCPAIAIVFNLPEDVCTQRSQTREDRVVEAQVIRWHLDRLRQSLPLLSEEGFAAVHVLNTPEEVSAATILREPLPFDRWDDHGPFDIIGDVHGCFQELCTLLERLGYTLGHTPLGDWTALHPEGRKLLFVGDLVDRGPGVAEVLHLVMSLEASGQALSVIGNHDDKLLRYLGGNPVKLSHGLAVSVRQLETRPESFLLQLKAFLARLPSHYILDGGKLVVAHAGLREDLHGRDTRKARDFALYGEVSGQTDEAGFPIRGDWASRYHGEPYVVYGHTVIENPTWVNRTINIDTGCVFGSRLTALRYPEMELLSVPALATYWDRPAPTDPTPTEPESPPET